MTEIPPTTFNPTSDGYDFSTDPYVTVLRGVAIGSGQDIGIYGGLALDVLLNQGRIHSDHSFGVAIISPSISQVTNAEITNASGAVISGVSGAYMETDGPGGALTFNNSGAVNGTTPVPSNSAPTTRHAAPSRRVSNLQSFIPHYALRRPLGRSVSGRPRERSSLSPGRAVTAICPQCNRIFPPRAPPAPRTSPHRSSCVQENRCTMSL